MSRKPGATGRGSRRVRWHVPSATDADVPNPSDPLAIARRTAAEFRERVLARDAQEQRREKIRTALGRCAFLMAPSNPKFFNERPDGEALKLEFRWAVAAQMTPLDKRWPAANAAYCRLWLERWGELAAGLFLGQGLPAPHQ